ncbi:hypothetical protein R6Q59_004223 [Mikania micrantha]
MASCLNPHVASYLNPKIRFLIPIKPGQAMFHCIQSKNSFKLVTMQFKIYKVLQEFNFRGQVGFLQFWEDISGHDDSVRLVVGQLYRLNGNHDGLTAYRATCLHYDTFIGPDTHVDPLFFAGLAAQTGFADQRTNHDPNQFIGQLVIPVYTNLHTFLGVIEFVTPSPKESYVDDFNQLYGLLKNENLTTPEEKTVKVEHENKTRYGKDIIKFSLRWTSAGMNDIWREVTQRFKRVKQDAFQINIQVPTGVPEAVTQSDLIHDPLIPVFDGKHVSIHTPSEQFTMIHQSEVISDLIGDVEVNENPDFVTAAPSCCYSIGSWPLPGAGPQMLGQEEPKRIITLQLTTRRFPDDGSRLLRLTPLRVFEDQVVDGSGPEFPLPQVSLSDFADLN